MKRKKQTFASRFQNTADDLFEYGRLEVDSLKLRAVGSLSSATSGIISTVLLVFVAGIALFFLGVTLTVLIARWTGSLWLAAAIMTAFFILLALILFFLRKKLFAGTMVRTWGKALADDKLRSMADVERRRGQLFEEIEKQRFRLSMDREQIEEVLSPDYWTDMLSRRAAGIVEDVTGRLASRVRGASGGFGWMSGLVSQLTRGLFRRTRPADRVVYIVEEDFEEEEDDDHDDKKRYRRY